MPKITITLEANEYNVYRDNGPDEDGDEDEDFLHSFDRSTLGDEVAHKMARLYKEAYLAGYEQAGVDEEFEGNSHA